MTNLFIPFGFDTQDLNGFVIPTGAEAGAPHLAFEMWDTSKLRVQQLG
jgi:hypothetical protein